MFMLPMRSNGVVEVEAVEHLVVEVPVQLRVSQRLGVAGTDVLASGDEVAGGAARGVTDDIGWRRCRHLYHELDDVARRTELAVLPSRCDLRKHVLVDVALGVSIDHRHLVETVDGLLKQAGGGDCEAGVTHVAGVGRALAAEGAQEREDVLAHEDEHLRGCKVLEAAPAVVLERASLVIGAVGEDDPG
jgi:hypothetical protein